MSFIDKFKANASKALNKGKKESTLNKKDDKKIDFENN